jgi:serine/threonine protein kinase
MLENDPLVEGTVAGDTPDDDTGSSRPEHAEMRDPIGEILGGRFEVQQEIGTGAFAITYQGRDLRLGRTVAIKVLRQTFATNPIFVQRFEREALAAASVAQANVVDVYDFGQHDDLLYIVMQYINGEDLKHLIAREGPLPQRRAVEITLQMLAGLAAIHEAGIIHRDIKPQNVMIGRDGIARVTDFGIAHVAVEAGLTTVGTTVGTASYMAPEQAQASTLVKATDLYSVGIVLYEMLTARLPFEAPTMIGLMLAHIQTRPVPPSSRAPAQRIAPELDAVVMRALAKRPEDRFADAPAMASALAAAIGRVPPGEEPTRLVPVADTEPTGATPQPAWPVASTWPAAAKPSDQRVPSLAMSRRPARRWDRALTVALLLLLLLGGVLGGAALLPDWGDGDDEPDDGSRELVADLNPTPTAAEQVVPTPTEPPVPTNTPAPTPTEPPPTETPTPPPTKTPEPVPTDTPVPTPTETPQPVPTDTPAPVPTEPPVEIEEAGVGDEADETFIASGDEADEPDETGDGEEIEAADLSGGDENTAIEKQGESGTRTLSFAASDWQGAYFQETGNLQPWSAVYAQSTTFGTATLRFTVDGEPATETFNLTVEGMTSENWTEMPISISVNGQEVYRENSPFPTWNGVDGQQPWATASFDLPTSVLQPGENTVTFTNLMVEGEFSRPPYILLADGTLTIEVRDSGGITLPGHTDTLYFLEDRRHGRRLARRTLRDGGIPLASGQVSRNRGHR